jgi:hypothetical protein
MRHYILKGRETVPIETRTLAGLIEWARWFEKTNRRVAFDIFCGGVHVSTVFLGIDHGFSLFDPRAKPVLFETMVFGGKFDQAQQRYCTYDQAEIGHMLVAQRVKYYEGKRGYSRSHWRKIRQRGIGNVIPFARAVHA